MAFEAATVAHARQAMPNKLTSTRQPDPTVEAATADVWQPVPRKHTSNRQPKSGTDIPPGSSMVEVGNVSGGTGSKDLSMGCAGLDAY
ncbi:hypothetical protein OIU79_029112 [Salix purpurea]|uniref:Uncharacterized protein n=1 Tax=Salix purpurea TaxID=77065 RepID=A0A9Q0NX48_SALPP|nr:hypothetical protein OIU79_029112 [Salix purpurea]